MDNIGKFSIVQNDNVSFFRLGRLEVEMLSISLIWVKLKAIYVSLGIDSKGKLSMVPHSAKSSISRD